MIQLPVFDPSLFNRICYTQAYFDAIRFRLSWKLYVRSFTDSFLLDRLRELNDQGKSPVKDSVKIVPYKMKGGGDWSDYILDIKQPTRAALECLHNYVDPVHPLLMNGMEIALDHHFYDVEEAHDMMRFYLNALIQGRNTDEVKIFEEMAFYKRKWHKSKTGRIRLSDRNIVIYADKGGRWQFESPVCHLEVRFTDPASIKKSLKLLEIPDLFTFDFVDFFARELTLFDINNEEAIQHIVKRMLGKGDAKKAWWRRRYKLLKGRVMDIDLRQRFRRAFLILASVEVSGEEVICAHNLKLIGDLWHGDDEPEAMWAEDYLNMIDKPGYMAEEEQKKKVYFETRWFKPIDNSPLLHLENMIKE